jgi:hypothetical protein
MHHINEFGFVVFTYPNANSALETVTDFRKVLNDEPIMQAIYRTLHPVPSAFFEGKQLWDKVIEASKLTVFIQFYMMIKHNRTLNPNGDMTIIGIASMAYFTHGQLKITNGSVS